MKTILAAVITLFCLSACAPDSLPNKNTLSHAPEAAENHAEYNPPVVSNISSLRPTTAIDRERMPAQMAVIESLRQRRTRAYPMQPPTIPHNIDGYQLDAKANQCMSCHSRVRTQESGAIMVSVTHYMNREGQFLAEISPRRYFCTQCHIVQHAAEPLVGNTFLDMQPTSVK